MLAYGCCACLNLDTQQKQALVDLINMVPVCWCRNTPARYECTCGIQGCSHLLALFQAWCRDSVTVEGILACLVQTAMVLVSAGGVWCAAAGACCDSASVLARTCLAGPHCLPRLNHSKLDLLQSSTFKDSYSKLQYTLMLIAGACTLVTCCCEAVLRGQGHSNAHRPRQLQILQAEV